MLRRIKYRSNGFTLLELLVTVAIVGTLSAIVAPNWKAFTDAKKVSSLAEKAYAALHSTQSQAIQSRLEKVIQFRVNNGSIEYSIYTQNASPQIWENIGLGNFHSETDFTEISFDFQGNVIFPTITDDFPTIAFTHEGNQIWCVQVRTLLGAMSIEENDRCIP